MSPCLVFAVIYLAFLSYILFLGHHHTSMMERSDRRIQRGDYSVTWKMNAWGIIKEVPAYLKAPRWPEP